MKSLYYLSQEQENQPYKNNVGTLKHKQLEFQCVDLQSNHLKIVLDFIDLKELPSQDKRNSYETSNTKNNTKKISLIYFSQLPMSNMSALATSTSDLKSDLQQIAEVQCYDNFDAMYNCLTEKLINNIIDKECDYKQFQHEYNSDMRPQNLLLINDKCKKVSPQRGTSPKKEMQPLYSFQQPRSDQIKPQRLNKEQKIIQQRILDKKECTFSPKINKSPKEKKFRSPTQFYQDMISHKEKVDMEVESKRIHDELQFQSITLKKTTLNNKSRHDFFERLHSEELKRTKQSQQHLSQLENNKILSSRNQGEIVQQLYSEHFLRECKLKALHDRIVQQENKENQEAIDFSRSNQILSTKIIQQVKQAYIEMRLQYSDLLSFFNLVEILYKLGYVQTLDETEKYLLNLAWKILIVEDRSKSEQGVSQRNLVTFLQAVDNLFVPTMLAYPCSIKNNKQFGFLINDVLYFEDEIEVKRLHLAFQVFSKNRTDRAVALKRESSQGRLQALESTFKPAINPKSQAIASDSLERLTKAIKLGSGNPHAQVKHEDILISKGKLTQAKVMQEQQWRQEHPNPNCTFAPQLLPTALTPSAAQRKSRNVFECLYDKAKTQQSRLEQKLKQRREQEQEQRLDGCTFRPDLSRTQRINQQVDSAIAKQQSQRKFILYQTLNNSLPQTDQEYLEY